jgi:hypothetical protein
VVAAPQRWQQQQFEAAEEENGEGKAKDSSATTWSVFAPFSFSMDAVASHPLLSPPVAFS